MCPKLGHTSTTLQALFAYLFSHFSDEIHAAAENELVRNTPTTSELDAVSVDAGLARHICMFPPLVNPEQRRVLS